MGVAIEAGSGVAKDLIGHVLVAVGALADGEIAAPALIALTADDGEGHHHTVTDLELFVRRADLHHFAHELMAHDVAVLHAGHEAVVQVQVGAADGTGRHFDDGVAGVFYRRIGYMVVAANVVLAVPAKGSHWKNLLLRCSKTPPWWFFLMISPRCGSCS